MKNIFSRFKDRSMIKVLDTYSFMDLLKDYNYVPEADRVEAEFQSNIAAMVGFVKGLVKEQTTDYDFMDLLSNNGLEAVNDDWSKDHSNDNGVVDKIAS